MQPIRRVVPAGVGPGDWPGPFPSSPPCSARSASRRRRLERPRPRAGTSPPFRARVRTTSCSGRRVPTPSQCWAVGVSIQHQLQRRRTSRSSRPGTGRPGRGCAAAAAGQRGGGFFGVSCLNGSDCWAVGTVLNESGGNGNPDGDAHRALGRVRLVDRAESRPRPATAWPVRSCRASAARRRRAVSPWGSRPTATARTSMLWHRAVERRGVDHRPGRRHRTDLRPAVDRAVPCRRRLLGGGQRRARPAEPQLPSHLSQCSRGPGADRALGRHSRGRSCRARRAPSPSGGYLNGLECVDGHRLLGFGRDDRQHGMASGILMQHWDGSSWTDVSASVPEPNPGTGAILSSISCLEHGAVLGGGIVGAVRRRWRR